MLKYAEKASAHAADVDSVASLINWISLFFFVLIIGLMVFFMFRYRRRGEGEKTPHISHNLVLEIAWSVIPLAIILVFFVKGYKTFINVMAPPAHEQTTDIYVTGSSWKWKFEYSNGGDISSLGSLKLDPLKLLRAELRNLQDAAELTEDNKKRMTELDTLIPALKEEYKNSPLKGSTGYFSRNDVNFIKDGKPFISDQVFTVPVGKPIRLVITSTDVLHSFAIPAMRVKRDAVPGQKREFRFTPIKKGTYHYTCNEMCGMDHAFMVGWLNVVSEEEYEKFLTSIEPNDTDPPIVAGKKFYEKNCKACHSITKGGSTPVAPSWYGIWGADRKFVEGHTTKVNAQYITDAINDPGKERVEGYATAMPSQGKFKERDIKNLIEFIKTLSDDYKAPLATEEASKTEAPSATEEPSK